MNTHEAAVRSALRSGDALGRLIGRMGSADHPRGEVLVSYRNAQRGLGDVLGRNDGRRDVEAAEVLAGLRRSLRETAAQTLTEATAEGQRQALAQMTALGLASEPWQAAQMAASTGPALDAWMATVDAQTTAAQALMATGADVGEILGDAERAGVLRPAPVIAEGARWIAGALAGAWAGLIDGGLRRERRDTAEWAHQAVAAIDERTTDCCLRANGQVQPLDQPFQLTGTPRYASELDHPPFHWYCRTAEALVPMRTAQDDLTQQMIDAAQAELRARGPDGKHRVEIHPAHARSRRP